MSLKLLERLLFAQGAHCFFCAAPLARADASVEHLVASSHGGSNHTDNCVACCKALNALFADMPLKAKLEIVLRQRGDFRCPRTVAQPNGPRESPPPRVRPELLHVVIEDLNKRGEGRPKSVQTLCNALTARFAAQLNGVSPQELVDRLCHEGVVLRESDGTVSYPLMELRTLSTARIRVRSGSSE